MSQSDQSLISAESFLDLTKKDFSAPQVWIGPSVLPKGGKLLFGGLAKAGKSQIMLEFVRALATGTNPFCHPGLFVPEPAKVLVCEQELGAYGMQRRIRQAFFDVPEEVLATRLFYVSKRPELKLDTKQGRQLVRKLLDQVQPNVLVLDPVSKFHVLDENSNSDIARLLAEMDRIIAEYSGLNLSIILSHHFGKPIRDPRFMADPLDPYNFRGSSNWPGDMDTLVTVHRVGQLPSITDWEAWRVRTRWIARHGEAPVKELVLSVNRYRDLRVRYEKEVESSSFYSSTT